MKRHVIHCRTDWCGMEEDWNTVYDDVAENPSYGYFIEEFNGTEEEWNELDNTL